MLRYIVHPTVFAFIAFCFAPTSVADIVFENFDAGGGFSATDNTVAVASRDGGGLGGGQATRLAVRFTVVGGNFTLDSLDLPISYQGDVEGNDVMRVRITQDVGTPGATLETLSSGENIWPTFTNPFSTITNLESSSNPLLENGQSYWIVTEPTEFGAGADYRWFQNTSGNDVRIIQQQQSGGLPSDPWPSSNSFNPLAFRVNGTAVPEPDSLLLVAMGVSGLLVKRRRK